MSDPSELVEGVRAGDRRAVARAISLAERLEPEGRRLVQSLAPHGGRAMRLGVTGPPGVGKSTLIGALITLLRERGLRVAVVAVDPTSPFSGGAVLGDRVRLADHFVDEGVFIRSMASRGHVGGLAEATAEAVLVLDAAGFEVVIVETVGAGQGEVEVQALVETVVLALAPGGGDAIQALKAGVMEIPDIVVVNQADRPGSDRLRSELRSTLSLAPPGGWRPPLVTVRALEGEGLPELWEQVDRHREALGEEGIAARRREGVARRLRGLAVDALGRRLDSLVASGESDDLAESVAAGEVHPADAAEALIERLGG